MTPASNKTVSLVLGSGGARGLAHIGVIHWLEENGYQIKSISGCSMGALIGGVYAADKLDEFEHWVKAITKVDIITLLDLSWQRGGLVKGDKIINTLVDLVGDLHIEDLAIKYTAVASDISNGKEVWINSGRLFDAIRASISLPLFFTPVDYNGIKLIDGGVLNPVPIAPTFNDNTDLTIAVNLNCDVEEQHDPVLLEPTQEEDGLFRSNINRFINHLKQSFDYQQNIDWGIFDVSQQAFEAMQVTIARQKLAAYPPDKIIGIARNACTILEFDRADEMIRLGKEKAEQCFSQND